MDMHLKNLARGDSWMTPDERRHVKKFVAAIARLFSGYGVEETPLLTLRVGDVAIHHLLVRRLEKGLAPVVDNQGERVAELSGALADQIGKGRERLRKAVRELEDACARLGRPIDVGLADRMLPLVRKTQDLLHDVELPAQEDTEE